MGLFLLQLFASIQQMLTTYSNQVNANAQRQAKLDACNLLLDQLRRILEPLLDRGAQALPALSEAAISQALETSSQLIDMLSRYAVDQASDYLEDRSLSPALAAAAGSRLYKALEDLQAITTDQQRWINERAPLSFLERTFGRRPQLPDISPADLDIKLFQLALALQITQSDTQRALSDLDQTRNLLRYLLPGVSQVTDLTMPPSAASSGVTGPRPTIRITTSTAAAVAALKEAREAHSRSVAMVEGHVMSIMNDLRKATMPGGGVNPHNVRIAVGTTLYICALALPLIQAQRDAVALIGSNIVNAGL